MARLKSESALPSVRNHFPSLLLLAGALAASGMSNGALAVEAEIPEVPGLEIFGFSAGTDTGSRGDRGFANELNGYAGKRVGAYTAISNKMEFSYTPFDNLWTAASAFVSYDRIRGNPALPDVDAMSFQGVSTEAEVRLIRRTASNPFAVAVSAEPFFSDIDLVTGRKSLSYGAGFKLLVDAVVVPNRIYWAFNAIWAPVRSQDNDNHNAWVSGSATFLQTALTLQLSEKLFAGAEFRQLGSFDALWFGNRLGYASYLGPTMLWRLTDSISFNATWQPQLTGRSARNPTQPYDLDTFERAEFRFKLAVDLK